MIDIREALVDAAEKFIAAGHAFDRPEDAIACNVARRMAARCEEAARSIPSPLDPKEQTTP